MCSALAIKGFCSVIIKVILVLDLVEFARSVSVHGDMVQCIDTKTLLVLLLKLIIIVLLLHPKCSSSSIEENLTNMLTHSQMSNVLCSNPDELLCVIPKIVANYYY